MEHVSTVGPELLVMPQRCVQGSAEYLGSLSFCPGALNLLFCLACRRGEE